MITLRPITLVQGLVLLVALASCGGSGSGSGGSGSSGGEMYIQTCSLGCSSGETGSQVSCALVSAYVNQDLAVYFSEPIDPSSINSSSVKLVDVNSGGVPTGLRIVDPLNPRKLIFRPSVAFNSTTGTATFGFDANRTYRILVAGTAQGDPGPFIRSQGGSNNKSRLQCEIQTTLGVTDFVPGAPTFEVRVDQAIVATPNPNDTIPNISAAGAVDVWRNSTIRVIFNDLMNPATLAPGGVSSFVMVSVDADGDLESFDDRSPLAGTWVVQQDTALLRTTMTFTPTGGLPSAGDLAFGPHRKVVVSVPSDVTDLSGNQLGNPTTPTTPVAFTPEELDLPPTTLPDSDGEQFVSLDFYDATRSSAEWGGGMLTRGYGGGSGRLGELVVKLGETVTLNTDSQAFPLASQPGYDILTNLRVGVDYFPGQPALGPELPLPLVLTDGTFEFSSIRIETGGTLLITGSKPARLFSRGSINIQGLLDISGRNGPVQSSVLPDGGAGGAGGPNGGAGGKGATRFSAPVGSPLLTVNANPALSAIIITDPNIVVMADGSPGTGVVTLTPPFTPDPATAGGGGLANPVNLPTGTLATQRGDLTVSNDGQDQCRNRQVASPGGGGAYATDGLPAVPVTPQLSSMAGNPILSNLPPPGSVAGGGSSSSLGIEAPGDPISVRSLVPALGLLRGGAGGGGGGRSLFDTNVAGTALSGLMGCNVLSDFRDHSAAGGGGGGGGIEIESGRTLTISGTGQIDASGGDGGSGAAELQLGAGVTQAVSSRQRAAAPGGGGAGGAVRALAQIIDLTGTTEVRINLGGGVGGSNSPPNTTPFSQLHLSRGGRGGLGLIRLEASLETLVAATEAPHIFPSDALEVGPASEKILTVGHWDQPKRRPESYTGAVSCWIKPTGNFFQVVFREDELSGPPSTDFYGWNMDLRYDSGSGEQLIKFRGPDPNLPFTPGPGQVDFEDFLGNTLNHGLGPTNGSYLAVRFQGALSIASLSQPCSVSLDAGAGQVLPGSLTPWVTHPGELNAFSPRPNMLRYCVVFDTSLTLLPGSIPSFIKGVTNLKIEAQLD